MAFSAIAPQSTASTSSSSKKPCYDVFINHRGKDVKHTVAKSIYNMLVQRGVQTFLDEDELQLGDSFPAAIDEAMRSASVHVAIFSPNYAESVWCLEELSLMVKLNVTIIPVFYDVDPCHLRYVQEGKGIYADAFLLHQKKRQRDESPRYNPEKIKEWMEALNCVSYKTGCILSADTRDQGELLKKIVDSALEKMKKVSLDVATYPVGIDVALENFEREVGSSSGSQNVYIVGICGMGGIGKTTLAKAIFNSKLSSMSRSSFLFDIREISSRNSLHKLQAKLFKDLKIQDSELHHTDEGKEILKGLRPMTMLIVLDDVDNVEQMHCLMPPKDKLGQGSFIIVTTRDEGVLTSWGISCIYHMKPFDFFNAKELFCRHAFSHPYSEIEYKHVVENNANFQDLIERFVKACNGLLLSLKVLGAMVNKQSKEFWEAQLHKIFRMLPNEIAERLKLSYDALDLEDQQMFLDIACFFIGGKKSLVVHIWDGGEAGWETLVQKCLVGLNENGNIEMHDHLRDLGREIAREVSPFRIWNKEQISTLGGRTPIRGIVTATTLPWLEDEYVLYSDNYPLPFEHCMENFIRSPSLPGLKFLAVGGNDYRKEFATLSRGLVWLRWCDFTGISLPSWLSLADLRVLELYNARNLEKLWQDNVQLPLQLRELIISIAGLPKSIGRLTHLKKIVWTCFRGFPKSQTVFRGFSKSIGRLTHLKKIVLNGDACGINGNACGMRSLPEEFCQLRSLEFLELNSFPISSLPDNFGELRNLRTLTLRKLELTALPDSFKQLTALQTLDISYCSSLMCSSEMSHVLELMTRLQVLRIDECPLLEVLPHVTSLVSLREVTLDGTGLRELPNNIGQLTKLETLIIGSCSLTSLPDSLGELSCLTFLCISGCPKLECLPEALGRLSNLRNLAIGRTPIVELGLGRGSPSGCNLNTLQSLIIWATGVRRISISDDCCPTLEYLHLMDNNHLTEVETLPGNVRHIEVFSCERMKSMRGIGGLRNLQTLLVFDCRDLEVLPRPTNNTCEITIEDCPKLNNRN